MQTGDQGLGVGDRGSGMLKVSVVSPEQVLFEGEASSVLVPAYDGLIGILPRHAPLLALLGSGRLTVRAELAAEVFQVAGGFVQVQANVVRVLAEKAEPAAA